MEEENVEESTDGSLNLEISAADSETPPAEAVAQLHPTSFNAAKDAAKKSMQHPAIKKKMTSALWDVDSFDPFQLFKVDQEKCAKLTVFIISGSGITNGWLNNIIDKPDPYVKLEIVGTPNSAKKTTAVSDSKNPVWNQAFTFLVPDGLSDREYLLDIQLMDENVFVDEKLGKCTINLQSLNLVNGEDRSILASFGNGSTINLKIRKVLDETEPDMRYSLALCEDEKHFLHQRREIAFEAIINLLGNEKGPQLLKQVPVIGLLGSGGGFRAMVGLSAVFSTLWEEGIMDCISYVAGLSGSTWYLSFLYSHPDFPAKTPQELKTDLKDVVCKHLTLVIAKGIFSYLLKLKSKIKTGQPVSLCDLFGHILGDMVLQDRKDATLSSQRRSVYQGKAPLPFYSCLNVKNNVPANVFQDWVEFSPYEIGMPKYGAFLKTEHFGNKFYVGKIIRTFQEMPLHFLQGIWGSGFCILLKRFFNPWQDLGTQLTTGCQAECDAEKLVTDAMRHSGNDSEENSLEENAESSSASEGDDDESDSALHFLGRRNKRKKKKGASKYMGMFKFYLKSLLAGTSLMETRDGRAGLVFNPLRGLKPQETFPMSPFTPTKAEDTMDFKGFYEHTKCSAKKMYMVDAGLNFNIPFPVLLRPQRGVELYLSFDFTDRGGEDSPPFEELKLSEQWARLNHLPFPPVTRLAEQFEREDMREFYVFEDVNDPHCPVIIHFVLCNNKFRHFKAPGVPRESESEKQFADFKIYDGAETPYSTFNFHYTGEQFEQLHELVEFNVRLGIDEIKRQIEAGVARKKKLQHQRVDLREAPPRANHNGTRGESTPPHAGVYCNSIKVGKLKCYV